MHQFAPEQIRMVEKVSDLLACCVKAYEQNREMCDNGLCNLAAHCEARNALRRKMRTLATILGMWAQALPVRPEVLAEGLAKLEIPERYLAEPKAVCCPPEEFEFDTGE